MTWSFHHYYTNKADGLIGKLKLNEQERSKLINLRDIVRLRVKDVFEEARNIAHQANKQK
ncbi:hypothetical protein VII00023_03648, partial [Vibrio ichthyoenteri ATCC 700023]